MHFCTLSLSRAVPPLQLVYSWWTWSHNDLSNQMWALLQISLASSHYLWAYLNTHRHTLMCPCVFWVNTFFRGWMCFTSSVTSCHFKMFSETRNVVKICSYFWKGLITKVIKRWLQDGCSRIVLMWLEAVEQCRIRLRRHTFKQKNGGTSICECGPLLTTNEA